MKITKSTLQRIIKEELNKVLLQESISVEAVDGLNDAIERARIEIIQSHPSQTGIEQWDAETGEPYEGDPSEAAAEWIMEYVQEVLGNLEGDMPPKRQTGKSHLRIVKEKLKTVSEGGSSLSGAQLDQVMEDDIVELSDAALKLARAIDSYHRRYFS